MKVLICVRRLDKGGAEMLECRLAVELNKLGIETHIAAQYDEHVFDGLRQKERWMSRGVSRVCFLKSNRFLGILRAFFLLYTLQRKQQYDVIISNNSGSAILVSVVSFFTSFKHVSAFHTYLNEAILSHVKIRVWKHLLKKTDAFFSITDYVRKDVSHKMKLASQTHHTIYNSFLVDDSSSGLRYSIREELNLQPDSKLILMAGRIEARKGFDLAVEYMVDILKSPNVYMVIVGDIYRGKAIGEGRVGFEEELYSKIKRLKIEDSVLFLGYRSDLFQLMKQADVYLHLARHEGFGLVLLEAIAAGLPIVASHVGGIPEVLKDTPYDVFSLDDRDGIIEKVSLLMELNKDDKAMLTERAKRILPYYSDERRASEVKVLLESLFK